MMLLAVFLVLERLLFMLERLFSTGDIIPVYWGRFFHTRGAVIDRLRLVQVRVGQEPGNRCEDCHDDRDGPLAVILVFSRLGIDDCDVFGLARFVC